MARAVPGINAPLTQFQPVVYRNQAEQNVVLLILLARFQPFKRSYIASQYVPDFYAIHDKKPVVI